MKRLCHDTDCEMYFSFFKIDIWQKNVWDLGLLWDPVWLNYDTYHTVTVSHLYCLKRDKKRGRKRAVLGASVTLGNDLGSFLASPWLIRHHVSNYDSIYSTCTILYCRLSNDSNMIQIHSIDRSLMTLFWSFRSFFELFWVFFNHNCRHFTQMNEE